MDYVYYPHRDVNSLNSISDDSAIVGSSSQPYSPSNLDNAVEYTSNGPAHPPLSDKEYEEDRGDELLPPPKSQEDAGDEGVWGVGVGVVCVCVCGVCGDEGMCSVCVYLPLLQY